MNDDRPELEPAEIKTIAKQAGLNLSPEWFEDICTIYPYLAEMIARVRRSTAPDTEPAHIFHVSEKAR